MAPTPVNPTTGPAGARRGSRMVLRRIACAVLLAAIAGCSRGLPSDARSSSGPLILSAAASTREWVETVARQFQRQTGCPVYINLGGSSTLATQILQGAPADLFLSADSRWAEAVAAGGRVERQRELLTNTLVVITPQGNPAGISRLEDLGTGRSVRLALARSAVPAGRYADQALQARGLLDDLVGTGRVVRCQDVRAVLAYVERGEVDAGIVYRTDALVSRQVQVIHEVDPRLHDPVVYVLARLTGAPGAHPKSAALLQFMASDQSLQAAERLGFGRLPSDAAAAGPQG